MLSLEKNSEQKHAEDMRSLRIGFERMGLPRVKLNLIAKPKIKRQRRLSAALFVKWWEIEGLGIQQSTIAFSDLAGVHVFSIS